MLQQTVQNLTKLRSRLITSLDQIPSCHSQRLHGNTLLCPQDFLITFPHVRLTLYLLIPAVFALGKHIRLLNLKIQWKQLLPDPVHRPSHRTHLSLRSVIMITDQPGNLFDRIIIKFQTP